MTSVRQKNTQTAPRTFISVLIPAIMLIVSASCGSEEEKDKKSLGGNKPIPTPGPVLGNNQNNGDSLPKSGLPPLSPPDGTPSCTAPLTAETEINPDFNAGSKTLLVGTIDPSCVQGRIPVLWMSVTKGFRIRDAMACEKSNELANYNFKCVGTEGQFFVDPYIIIPVSLDPADVSVLKAEIEMVPAPTASPF